MPFLDQRQMTAGARLQTPTDVLRAWELFASAPHSPGFLRSGARHRSLLHTDETIVPYVNHGRWVADCPAPDCLSGIACWPDHGQACCLECGRIYNVTFPTVAEQTAVERILEARPLDAQNWDAHKGETVSDLKLENLRRGFSIIGKRELVRDVAEIHGIDETHARRLVDAIKKSRDVSLLPRDV